jgi:hypothetical protein
VSRRLITLRGRTVITKVSESLDPNTAKWDQALVQEIFWDVDVKRILAIPMKHDMDDLLAWHFDKKGVFSVKSAYHVLDDKRIRLFETSRVKAVQGSNSLEFRWKDIWKLKCPPKIKQFLRRLSHNSLPLRTNIMRRGMRSIQDAQ